MRTLLLIFISFISVLSYGQKTPSVLLSERMKKMDEKTKAAGNYYCQGKHLFFNSLQNNDTSFKCDYSILFDKKKDLFNIIQVEQFIIQNEEVMLIIDTVNMQIVVNKPNPAFKKSITGENSLEANKLIKEVTQKKLNNEERYLITFTERSSIESMHVHFSKDGLISKIISNAAYPVPDQTQGRDVMIQPRMEIVFTKYEFGGNVNTSTMKNVESVYNAENKSLTEEYKNFQLIDLRYNPTNK